MVNTITRENRPTSFIKNPDKIATIKDAIIYILLKKRNPGKLIDALSCLRTN